MSTILYGNLRAEIVGDAGVRLSLLAQRQPASGLLRPGQPSAPAPAPADLAGKRR